MRKRSIFTAFEGAHLDGALFGASESDRQPTLRKAEEGRRRSLLWLRGQTPAAPVPPVPGDKAEAVKAKPRP